MCAIGHSKKCPICCTLNYSRSYIENPQGHSLYSTVSSNALNPIRSLHKIAHRLFVIVVKICPVAFPYEAARATNMKYQGLYCFIHTKVLHASNFLTQFHIFIQMKFSLAKNAHKMCFL